MATENWDKDPDAILDWKFDWSSWLAVSETIATSDFEVSPGLTVTTDSHTNTNTTVWLSGGTPGVYRVTNRITTNQGRTDDRSITIRVKDR